MVIDFRRCSLIAIDVLIDFRRFSHTTAVPEWSGSSIPRAWNLPSDVNVHFPVVNVLVRLVPDTSRSRSRCRSRSLGLQMGSFRVRCSCRFPDLVPQMKKLQGEIQLQISRSRASDGELQGDIQLPISRSGA